jgi:hypothetical protein
VLGVLIVLVAFVLPQLRLRRSITSVIRIFREHNAVEAKNAKKPEQLGIRLQAVRQSLFSGGNMEAEAVQVLMNASIIQTVEGNKLYLSEEKLAASKFSKYDKAKATVS